MKTFHLSRANKGFAMILVMVFIVIMLIVLGATLQWAATDGLQTQRNNQYVASQYAAEAAVERVIGQMDYDYLQQSMTNANWYETVSLTNISNWPIQYGFSDPVNKTTNSVYVSEGDSSATIQPLPSPYDGLSAFEQQCEVAVTATPIGQRFNVPATVDETFLAASIPIFQYVIFYNLDLEIDPGSTMPINGPVFSNESIWSGTPNVTYSNIVHSVITNYTGTTDPFCSSKTDSGTPAANFVYKKAQQPVSGVTSLNLPIMGINNTNNSASNVESILQWPPSTYALGSANAYTTNGQIYLANEADLIISNASFGTIGSGLFPGIAGKTNLAVYYQDSTLNPPLMLVSNDFYVLDYQAASYTTNTTTKNHKTTTTITTSYITAYFTTNYIALNWPGRGTNLDYVGYSFLTNDLFYDWREGSSSKAKSVQAVQFDVAAFNAWLSGTNEDGTTNRNGGKYYNSLCDSYSHKNHPIDGIYINTSVPLSSTVLPAVRVLNGSHLFDSHGLTIATPFPVYVQGDYNVTDGVKGHTVAGSNLTTYAQPAAFLADAITVVSANWDGASKDPTPTTSTITINAACLEGIVPSKGSNYSGGVENFLRLLEGWGGKDVYYNGSIVVMFPSQYATNIWGGGYYGVPVRKWAFDTNFTTQAGLPPMTPQVKAFVRQNWDATQNSIAAAP